MRSQAVKLLNKDRKQADELLKKMSGQAEKMWLEEIEEAGYNNGFQSSPMAVKR